MKVNQFAALLCGVLFLTSAGTAIGAGMKPGLWEIKSTMEMPGMPFTPPPTTVKHCYTAEEVKNDQSTVPQPQDCKVTELKTTGNKTTWKLVCVGSQQGTAAGEMTFKGDSAYDGMMTFRSEEMNMITRYQARRVGECK